MSGGRTVGIPRRVGVALFVAVVLLAGCSDDGDGAATTTATGSDSTAPTTTSAATTTTTTEPAPEVAPAGVNWVASAAAPPPAAPVPTWDAVTATAGVPPAPAGFPYRQSDYISAVYELGGVLLATGSCGCWEGGNNTGVFGGLRTPVYLFRSADGGSTWAQVDLSAALGDVNGRVGDIVEHDGGLLMAVTFTDADGAAPGAIGILRSADGSDWQRVATVGGDPGGAPAVEAFSLQTVGGSLVLVGGDAVCVFDGSDVIQSIGTTYQPRLWTSVDGGSSWAAQARAATVLDTAPAAPADASACAGLGLAEISTQWRVSQRAITTAGDRLFVWSADGVRLASTADGLEWTTAELAGAVALQSESSAEPVAESEAAGVFQTAEGWVAVNVEARRDTDDHLVGGSGVHVVGWISADGQEWQRMPLGRPLAPAPDGRLHLFATETGLGLSVSTFDEGVVQSFVSEPSPVVDWTRCVLAPGAACAFATSVEPASAGAGAISAAGADLSFMVLDGTDLSGADLSGAVLRGTQLYDVVLEGADLSGADLSSATFYSDPSGIDFTGATFDRTEFDGRFFLGDFTGATVAAPRLYLSHAGVPADVSLAGRDLTGYSFINYGADTSFVARDLSGANLTDAYFYAVDLTGANFTGAIMEGITFSDVICPDALPSDAAAPGAPACRL
ncbi:MAG: pentapeptide repeat-containing protein [Actinomycetota bacterium]|nr:pentapeptide repeat-containing protein [Actinomycetota bacterium]